MFQLCENVWNSIKVCTVDQVLWSRFRIFRWGPQRTTQYSESLNWLNSKANGEEFRMLCFYMLCYPPSLAWLNILALNCSLMAFKTLKLKIPLYKIFCFLLLVYKEKYLKLPSKISTLKQLVILFSDSLQFLKSLFPLSAVQHTELIDISFLLFSSEWMLIFMFCNKMFCAR